MSWGKFIGTVGLFGAYLCFMTMQENVLKGFQVE